MATSNQSSQKKKKYAKLRILGVSLFVLSILTAPLNLIVGAVLGFSGIWMTTYYRTFMEESRGHTPTPCFKRIFPVLGAVMLALWIGVGSTVASNPNNNSDVSPVSTIENSSSEQKTEKKAAEEAKSKQEAEKKAAEQAKAKQEAEKKAAEEAKAKQEAEKKAAEEANAKQEAEKKAAEQAKAKQEAEKKAAEEAKAKQEAEKKAAEEAAKATNPPPPSAPNSNSVKIYITPTGKRYHYDSKCNGGTYNESTLDKAKELGLTPCSKCVA